MVIAITPDSGAVVLNRTLSILRIPRGRSLSNRNIFAYAVGTVWNESKKVRLRVCVTFVVVNKLRRARLTLSKTTKISTHEEDNFLSVPA